MLNNPWSGPHIPVIIAPIFHDEWKYMLPQVFLNGSTAQVWMDMEDSNGQWDTEIS